MQKLYHGAEAVITREDGVVTKERVVKGYRIKQIDESMRERRTRREARLLREARRSGVMTPQVLEENRFTIKMEFIDGERAKDIINAKNFAVLARKIGEKVATLHDYNIIHGDLTTSNMIAKLKEKKNPNDESSTKKVKRETPQACFDLYFIDFGLGFFSHKPEDKATDLHVLKEAITSTHFEVVEKMWKIILDAYKDNYSGSEKVIKALSKIEKRGRYVER